MTIIRTIDYGSVEWTVDLGLGIELMFMTDGKVRLAHDCKLVGEDERERVAPPMSLRSIFTPPPVTITPSFRCEECGLDGWVIRGQWCPS